MSMPNRFLPGCFSVNGFEGEGYLDELALGHGVSFRVVGPEAVQKGVWPLGQVLAQSRRMPVASMPPSSVVAKGLVR